QPSTHVELTLNKNGKTIKKRVRNTWILRFKTLPNFPSYKWSTFIAGGLVVLTIGAVIQGLDFSHIVMYFPVIFFVSGTLIGLFVEELKPGKATWAVGRFDIPINLTTTMIGNAIGIGAVASLAKSLQHLPSPVWMVPVAFILAGIFLPY